MICPSTKNKAAAKALIVTGCMAQRYKKEIQEEIPEVDAILGTNSYDKILDAVDEALAGHQMLDCADLVGLPEVDTDRILTTGGHYAYLKIAEGCNKRCTYCIILPFGEITGASPWKNWWSRHRNLQKKESKS